MTPTSTPLTADELNDLANYVVLCIPDERRHKIANSLRELAALRKAQAEGVSDEMVLIATAAAIRKTNEIDPGYSAMREGDLDIMRAALEAVAPMLGAGPVAWQYRHITEKAWPDSDGVWHYCAKDNFEQLSCDDEYETRSLYAAPPSPVQVRLDAVNRAPNFRDDAARGSAPAMTDNPKGTTTAVATTTIEAMRREIITR